MKRSARVEMPLVVVGCDFRIASSRFRETLVTTAEERRAIFESLSSMDPGAGFVALETCNRVEWIVSSRDPKWTAGLLSARMLDCWNTRSPGEAPAAPPYVFTGAEAASHVLRVVAGLESMAAGEAQIAGQFQRALLTARNEQTTSETLNGLASSAGRLAKATYRTGFRSDHGRGVHGLVAACLKNEFANRPAEGPVVVAGMGQIGRKAAALLESALGAAVVPVNRTVGQRHKGAWRPWADLPAAALGAWALVAATGSPRAVLGVKELSLEARTTPLVIVDIGVPRQVDAEAARHPMACYRCLDDLVALGLDGAHIGRAPEAEKEVRKEVALFRRFCLERDMVQVLDAAHRSRHDYLDRFIPGIVARTLPELDEETRRKVESTMQKLIRDYSNGIFESIHASFGAEGEPK